MNYEKLNLARFEENLGENKYAGITGARRAIGKTAWSDSDKAKAHKLANAHFGVGAGETSAPKRAAKPAARKTAKRAAKVAAKPAKRAAKVAAKPAAKAAPTSRAVVRRRPSTPPAPQATLPNPQTRYEVASSSALEEVTRQNSASAVIAALKNSGDLTEQEKYAYEVAVAEYGQNASQVARNIMAAANRTFQTPERLRQPVSGTIAESPFTGVSTQPGGEPPRIHVPAEETGLQGVELEEYKRLERAAAAAPHAIGQTPAVPPPAPPSHPHG